MGALKPRNGQIHSVLTPRRQWHVAGRHPRGAITSLRVAGPFPWKSLLPAIPYFIYFVLLSLSHYLAVAIPHQCSRLHIRSHSRPQCARNFDIARRHILRSITLSHSFSHDGQFRQQINCALAPVELAGSAPQKWEYCLALHV